MKPQNSLNAYFQQSVRDNWNRLSLTDFNGETLQYKDVARKIAKLHILFEKTGIRPGDRVALCGRNSANWAVIYFATLTYGAVLVPIQHEFKSDNIHHLVNHSESKLLFVANSTYDNLDPELMPAIKGAIRIKDFSVVFSRSEELDEARAHLNELFGRRYPERFTAADVVYYEDKTDELALINYTSGSTGFSKGVMLSFGNLWSNLQYCIDKMPYLEPGDEIVALLPMAHVYGMTCDLLQGFVKGVHINFLTRLPSPRVILEAFAKIRPKIVITVPLILEKIVKQMVYPLLDKPLMKLLLRIPTVNQRLLRVVRERLEEAFGGRCQEIMIGGAALNREMEVFLNWLGFMNTNGYGMTECGPFITYSPKTNKKTGSCGFAADRMELKVDSPNPAEVPGVLWVRGANMMLGYYKNPEATAAVMRDGWMSTGDICTMDDDGFIFLRGRDKNMILTSNGQNIYPEEIEQKLNNMPYVGESLIIDEDGRLVALIYPDIDNAAAQGINVDQLDPIMTENLDQLNREVPAYAKVTRYRIMTEEFEKTPKKSIKRYLYQHS